MQDTMDTENDYDPFSERRIRNPMTDYAVMIHLLRAALGIGILAMPLAFKKAGLILGIFATIFVSFICSHYCFVIVKCAHILCYKMKRPKMSYPDLSEYAFANGPSWARSSAKPARYAIQTSIFVLAFSLCSVYSVLAAANFQQVLEYYLNCELSARMVKLTLGVPMILLSIATHWKYLLPISLIANVCMACGLFVTLCYFVKDMRPMDELNNTTRLVGESTELPYFLSVAIFSMGVIGVILPLENRMVHPKSLLGYCGVLNRGLFFVTFVYVVFGCLGYLRYGDEITFSVTLNLPITETPARAVKVIIGFAILCTIGLQFQVCLDVVKANVMEYFQRRPVVANYSLRIGLISCANLLGIALPSIPPFTALIGAVCFSNGGIIIPAIIETVMFWDKGFGKFYWIAVKNSIFFIFGILAMILGTGNFIAYLIELHKT